MRGAGYEPLVDIVVGIVGAMLAVSSCGHWAFRQQAV